MAGARFSSLLGNPLFLAVLGAKGAGDVAGAYNEATVRGEQGEIAQSLVQGSPVTETPRRGLSRLIAKTGLISPNAAVDPQTQALEGLAVRQQRNQELSDLVNLRATLGPQNFAELMKNPDYAAMATRAGVGATGFEAPLPKEQQFQAGQRRLDQQHQDTERDRAATLAETRSRDVATQQERVSRDAATAQEHQINDAIRQQTEQERRQFNQTSQQLSAERDQNRRAALIDNLGKSIDASRDKILADFAKTPSTAFKARVEVYNSSASQFYRRHAGAGAPTLLKYSETKGTDYRVFQGGATPDVQAVPPEYGTNKKNRQPGWRDADGFFYPDTSTR